MATTATLRPQQTVGFRVYLEGVDLLGIANLELPSIAYMTETLSGSGLAGELDAPTIGLTQSMTLKMTFTSVTQEFFKAYDHTKQARYECYSALQVADQTSAVRSSLGYQVNVVGNLKTGNLGTMEQGKQHGNELELEVFRLEILYDGDEKVLIDKLNFIHKVNGTDLLSDARIQMGLSS